MHEIILAGALGDRPDHVLSTQLLACRMALDPASRGEAVAALASVASAPEMAGPWRLRAGAWEAGLHMAGGRPDLAVVRYSKLETEFTEELREAIRVVGVASLSSRWPRMSFATGRSSVFHFSA